LIRVAGPAGWWYFPRHFDLWSLLLLALLLFLLFGGSRIGAAGKGLGEAARYVKRAIRDSDPPPPPPDTMNALPESKEPKLLPAKGQSSASRLEDE
jgi:Sec-independent protein translocase protein TatA